MNYEAIQVESPRRRSLEASFIRATSRKYERERKLPTDLVGGEFLVSELAHGVHLLAALVGPAGGHIRLLIPLQHGGHMLQVGDLGQPRFEFLQFLFHGSPFNAQSELCVRSEAAL